jgi:hypothetical protein
MIIFVYFESNNRQYFFGEIFFFKIITSTPWKIFQINLDNEVVGIITRKDLAAPMSSTGINMKVKTAKKTTVLKGQQLKTAKTASRRGRGEAGQNTDLPYEELRT